MFKFKKTPKIENGNQVYYLYINDIFVAKIAIPLALTPDFDEQFEPEKI